jgi:tripartite ATP-independent transporter DctM subunit
MAASLIYQGGGGWFTALTVVFNIQGGITNFLYLAIPFFVMAGGFLTQGRLVRPLGALITLLLGRLKGQTAHAIVTAMFIFSGISGSKLADMAGVGAAMADIVRREGYPRKQVAALLAASAVMGETVPPSIGLLVLAPLVSLSVATLFVAGLVPAIVVAVCLHVAIFVRSHGVAYKGVRFGSRAAATTALQAMPSLIIPVILIGGIASGTGTPTEVSSFAVVTAFLMLALVARTIDLKAMRETLTATRNTLSYTSSMTGMVLFVLAGAHAFSYCLTVVNVPQNVGAAVAHIGQAWIYLLVTVAVMIVMGLLLEGLAAIIVLAPIMSPAAAVLGIDPIHYSIVLLISMALGAFLPPIGAGYYMATIVAGSEIDEAIRPTLFYLLIVFVGLIIIALVPQFSLFLPHALHRF